MAVGKPKPSTRRESGSKRPRREEEIEEEVDEVEESDTPEDRQTTHPQGRSSSCAAPARTAASQLSDSVVEGEEEAEEEEAIASQGAVDVTLRRSGRAHLPPKAIYIPEDPEDDDDNDDEPQVRREANRRRVNSSAKGSPPKVRFQGQREQPDPRRQPTRDRGARARERTRTSAEALDDPEDDNQAPPIVPRASMRDVKEERRTSAASAGWATEDDRGDAPATHRYPKRGDQRRKSSHQAAPAADLDSENAESEEELKSEEEEKEEEDRDRYQFRERQVISKHQRVSNEDNLRQQPSGIRKKLTSDKRPWSSSSGQAIRNISNSRHHHEGDNNIRRAFGAVGGSRDGTREEMLQALRMARSQPGAHNGGRRSGHRSQALLGAGGEESDDSGASGEARPRLPDIVPVEVDCSVTFDDVGGMDHHLATLKQMIFMPIKYPALCARMNITAPGGVIFYGPPGTGKTLLAKALASHARRHGQKMAFFQANTELLSKWVGEGEKNLRSLFAEAERQQPAIIFFDELDSIAPVRSNKQEQNTSFTSTLLVLMDGLKSRGQVVLIGATNRVDAIDGALRRPGRFDRELRFTLPSPEARRSILEIHACKLPMQTSPVLLDKVAAACVGFCGADLRALCTQASLAAVHRCFPALMEAEGTLAVDPEAPVVGPEDFETAFKVVGPSGQRAAPTPAQPLPPVTAPCLSAQLVSLLSRISTSFSPAAVRMAAYRQTQQPANPDPHTQDPLHQLDPTHPSTAQFCHSERRSAHKLHRSYATLHHLEDGPHLCHPRLLLCGKKGNGQKQLSTSLLDAMQETSVYLLSLSKLSGDPRAHSPDDLLVSLFGEACRAAPAILYLPDLDVWWAAATIHTQALLKSLLAELPAQLPLLLLATASTEEEGLHEDILDMFKELREPQGTETSTSDSVVELTAPLPEQRLAAFRDLVISMAVTDLPVLEAGGTSGFSAFQHGGECNSSSAQAAAVAASAAPVQLDLATVAAAEARRAAREYTKLYTAYQIDCKDLLDMQRALRELVTQVIFLTRYELFAVPLSTNPSHDCWKIIQDPMDLSTIRSRIAALEYPTAAVFLRDVSLIHKGAIEYYGGLSPEVSRAEALVADIKTMLLQDIKPDLLIRCDLIAARGHAPPPPGMTVDPPEPSWRPAHLRLSLPSARRTSGCLHLANGNTHEHAANGNSGKRSSARLQGVAGDCESLFNDPEAIGRQNRQRTAQAARLTQGGNGDLEQTAGELDTDHGDGVTLGKAYSRVSGHSNGCVDGPAGAPAVSGSSIEGQKEADQSKEPDGGAKGTGHAGGDLHQGSAAASHRQHDAAAEMTSNDVLSLHDSLVRQNISQPELPQFENRQQQQQQQHPRNRLKAATAAAAVAAAAAATSPFAPNSGEAAAPSLMKASPNTHTAILHPPASAAAAAAVIRALPRSASQTLRDPHLLPRSAPTASTSPSQIAAELPFSNIDAVVVDPGATSSTGVDSTAAAIEFTDGGAPSAAPDAVRFLTGTPEAAKAARKLLRYICKRTHGWGVDALVALHTLLTHKAGIVRGSRDRVEVLQSMRKVVKKYVEMRDPKQTSPTA